MPARTCIPTKTGISPLDAARFFVEKLRKPAHILVAISGGSDSTGLLLALREALAISPKAEVRLSAVTVDHALRPESAGEARKVAELCAELGIFHAVRRWDDPKPASGLSDASRLARYRLIAGVADMIGADVIVTGHTFGDQRETIAMRAARSDRDDNIGLSGMADAVLYDGRYWIMRPFLLCERQAIRDYLLSRTHGWVDDPSNENLKYERVRVRKTLRDTSFTTHPEISERRPELSCKAAALLSANVQVFHSVLAKINPEAVAPGLPEFRHGLAALLATLGGRAYFPAATGMDRAMAFVADGQSGRMTLGRVLLDRRRDGLYLFRERRNLPEIIVAPGTSDIWDDRFLIENRSDIAIRVASARTDEASLFSAVPSGVARQAIASMPYAVAGEGEAVTGIEAVSVVPMLAPFDLFLPRFDLELANEIAILFGRRAYPQPPV